MERRRRRGFCRERDIGGYSPSLAYSHDDKAIWKPRRKRASLIGFAFVKLGGCLGNSDFITIEARLDHLAMYLACSASPHAAEVVAVLESSRLPSRVISVPISLTFVDLTTIQNNRFSKQIPREAESSQRSYDRSFPVHPIK
nr:hypothetical protein Iba_chr08cCG2050 [Ipomoea batatas]